MSEVEFGVLGALEARRGGAQVRLPSGRQRAVLAALLARAGGPAPADSLIEAAWDEELPDDPRAALHTVLSRLRGALGRDAIRAEPTGYLLPVDRDAVDAARFEDLRARASDAPPREALDLLDEADSLWRGPAYAEFADRDFVHAEAVRLDELRLTVIEDRAELRLEVGAAAAAVAVLEPFVAEQPLRERARGLLMTALYRAGRLSEALDRYQDYRRRLADEFGLDPSPMLRELYARILNHDLPAAAPPVSATAPASPLWLTTDTAFVGRDEEAADLLAAAARHRVVTLTGAGGVGKTRLLAETLPHLVHRLGLPVTVVELAGVDDERVELAVAAALMLGPAPGDVGDAVLEYLSIAPRLLALDNCEHVVAGVRRFVSAALPTCPGLRIVATSRRRIGIPVEQVLPVEPLPVPARDVDPTAAELTAAIRLFVDRARRARPTFGLTAAHVPVVADICRRLDGLPLAIELAASRATTLGINALRERLDGSLDLLGGDDRLGERSMRSMLEWSYGLLAPDERNLLAALGVFDSDFDLEGAERVAAGRVDGSVAAALSGLVEVSLATIHGTGGSPRYRLLEIVRAFARERLAESGAEPEVHLTFARWAVDVAAVAARDTTGSLDADSLAWLGDEAGNMRAAVAWALAADEAELAGQITGALALGAMRWRPRVELADLLRQVAEHPAVGATAAASLARAGGAYAAVMQGDLDTAERLARAALETARAGDEHYLAQTTMGVTSLYRGDHDTSVRWWREMLTDEAIPLARKVDGHASLSLIATYRGDLEEAHRQADAAMAAAEAAGAAAPACFARYATAEAILAGDLEAAVPPLTELIRDADRLGVDYVGGLAATALLSALTRLGRCREALGLAGPLLERWLRLVAWPQLWTTMRLIAELLVETDRPESAALLLTAAEHAPSAPAVTGDDADRFRQLARTLRHQLGPRAHERLTAVAPALPRTQVLDRARKAVAELLIAAPYARPVERPGDDPQGSRPYPLKEGLMADDLLESLPD